LETLLKDLGIDYNEGIIIQLSLKEKSELKSKIEKVLNLSDSDCYVECEDNQGSNE
jgi:hypothetical protein